MLLIGINPGAANAKNFFFLQLFIPYYNNLERLKLSVTSTLV